MLDHATAGRDPRATGDLPAGAPAPRLVSLDAYRGFVMLAMVSGGLGLAQVARHFPDSQLWQTLGHQSSHVEWTGCTFWDLIQPSFMFMVGVALPYSYASRRARGDSRRRTAVHVLYRAAVLIALGIFLRSNGGAATNYTYEDVLTQIGLGYAFLYLVVGRGFVIELAVASAILAGYWLLFYLYPLPGPDFDLSSVGVRPDFEHFTGLFAHWNKNTNAAAAFDRWFLNLFPRPHPYAYNGGGYQTLSFIPSLATMIFGLMTGEMLKGAGRPIGKFLRLIAAGGVLLAAGWALGESVCPIVKRIWTPSWAIYSSGWACLILSAFFLVIDVVGLRRWALPLVIVGMNSIAVYVLDHTIGGWIIQTLRTHFGRDLFVGTYGPIWHSLAVVIALWLIALWMYRRRVFIRI